MNKDNHNDLTHLATNAELGRLDSISIYSSSAPLQPGNFLTHLVTNAELGRLDSISIYSFSAILQPGNFSLA